MSAATAGQGAVLSGRRVVLGVGGSIAAYKAASLARLLVGVGAQVRVVLTGAAARFVGPALFAGLTGEPVATDLFEPRTIDHIALARWADAGLVAPATADLLARAALGLADDYLTTWLLAFPGPVAFAPAMNHRMWEQPAVRRAVATLRADGRHLIGPVYGPLGAPGEGEGHGRLAEPEAIVAALASLLAPRAPTRFAGRRVVVTAGPTREPLDAVRFLSNRSSGRMGFALAEALRDRGAAVTVVRGPVALADPPRVRVLGVETALEMREAVRAEATGAAAVFAAAAVSDWRARAVAPGKWKRGGAAERTIELVANPDILAELGRDPQGTVLVGFAAEAGGDLAEARRKLDAKGLHLIVHNDVLHPDAGFEVETNRVTILHRDGAVAEVGPLHKRAVAEAIVDAAERWLPE